MAKSARIPITNIYMGGDYTGQLLVGPDKQPMNVILDTGSSALAIDGSKYKPTFTGGEKSTNLAQTDSYGDGSSWTGAVLNTPVTIGDGDSQVVLPDANVAVAYQASQDMFGQDTDGILGLAYAPLDDAFTMPDDTWKHQYSSNEVRTGQSGVIKPYLTQLADEGVVSDKISFITHRSFVHAGPDPATDPLNNGWMIVGGGEENTDLYTGKFQTVKVLSDDWYSTNLKSIIVGKTSPIAARLHGPQGMPSNSIIDSGTNSLNLSPQLLKAVISKFSSTQRELLNKSVMQGQLVDMATLNLADWPTIKFILQGETTDVSLEVLPTDYWQVNTENVGSAMAAITKGEPGLAILGLPIMNGYFTIFDGEADGGKGAIKFATKKPL